MKMFQYSSMKIFKKPVIYRKTVGNTAIQPLLSLMGYLVVQAQGHSLTVRLGFSTPSSAMGQNNFTFIKK